jgi:hypothetical protein
LRINAKLDRKTTSRFLRFGESQFGARRLFLNDFALRLAETFCMKTKLLLFALGSIVMFAQTTKAEEAGCAIRVTAKKETPLKVIVRPSGFTGRMTCTAEQLPKVLKTVQKTLPKEIVNEFTLDLSDLEFYPSLREELATTLSKDKNWNSLKGKPLQRFDDRYPDPSSSIFAAWTRDLEARLSDRVCENRKVKTRRSSQTAVQRCCS